MIDIHVIASGSTGNCYRITSGDDILMIECGIRYQRIRQAFKFQLSRVCGCLATHEHADHSMAAKDLMKAGVPVYMSAGTAEKLSLTGHRAMVVKPLEKFQVGSFTVLAFPTEHDAAEPIGFLVKSKSGEKLLFITDSYFCKYRFAGVNYFLVECNYSKEILAENIAAGLVSPSMESRIKRSHFELERVKEFFRANDLSKARGIWLIHISQGNGDPGLFKSEIEGVAGVPVYVADGGAE
jgi:phosphoribosyl 1,2-cyclic phosphodiesterase